MKSLVRNGSTSAQLIAYGRRRVGAEDGGGVTHAYYGLPLVGAALVVAPFLWYTYFLRSIPLVIAFKIFVKRINFFNLKNCNKQQKSYFLFSFFFVWKKKVGGHQREATTNGGGYQPIDG
jgi:hypothetical protein